MLSGTNVLASHGLTPQAMVKSSVKLCRMGFGYSACSARFAPPESGINRTWPRAAMAP